MVLLVMANAKLFIVERATKQRQSDLAIFQKAKQ
jgi:hypothetical protein